MRTYQYCVAENWGKGFIDHDESHRITWYKDSELYD